MPVWGKDQPQGARFSLKKRIEADQKPIDIQIVRCEQSAAGSFLFGSLSRVSLALALEQLQTDGSSRW